MDFDETLAEAQLKALVKIPGALRIITAEVVPELREDKSNRRGLPPLKAFTADPNLLKRPSSFVIHDVVKIEGPSDKGLYTAYSAEGDSCQGRAVSLLNRLQHWRL